MDNEDEHTRKKEAEIIYGIGRVIRTHREVRVRSQMKCECNLQPTKCQSVSYDYIIDSKRTIAGIDLGKVHQSIGLMQMDLYLFY